MRLQSDLTLFSLDNDTVVFSDAAQRLVGLNTSAEFVFRKLQNGESKEQIAASLVDEGMASCVEAAAWVESTLESLGQNGMLADASHLVRNKEFTEPILNAGMPPYVPGNVVAERRYRLLDTVVLIRFSQAREITWVDSVIGHLAARDDSLPTMVLEIQSVALGNDRFGAHIYRDQQPYARARRLFFLGPLVKGALWQSAVNAYHFLIYFHAAVVGRGKNCVLLPAMAGSGKSSLTAALIHRNFRYFSDEVALIETGTFKVPPVPLAVCTKSTGWDILQRYYPRLTDARVHHRLDGKKVRYLPPAAEVPTESASVSHIIFPRYSSDAVTELKPITRSEALRRLLEQCMASRLDLTADNVRELINWIAGIECYELPFSSLEDAADLVTEVTDERGQSLQ